MKRISTYTLGCKLNVAETSAMSEAFLKEGYKLVPFGEESDVTIINTCSVTEHADSKCRNVVRKALKKSPESFVAVVGCYAQLEPEELASIEGVDVVLGAKEKFDIISYISEHKLSDPQIHVSDISTVENFGFGHSLLQTDHSNQTRAYLKVQDGCDYTCSYCTIPLARGTSRSESIEKTIAQARMLIDAGYQEIVLTGVNIGDYGTKNGLNFFKLIQELDKLPIPRLRISSIEPNLFTSELIQFIAASKRIVPHFHMPLQSGSDAILRLMKRRYNTSLYRQKVEEVVATIQDVCIGADVIVGFPSESEIHFEETVQFIQSLPITYLHVFTFSKRPNTNAAELIDQGWAKEVEPQIKQFRSRKLQELSQLKKKEFVTRFLNTEAEVLFENEFSDDIELAHQMSTSEKLFCYGHTANYLRVGVEVTSKEWAREHLVRKLKSVFLHAVDTDLNIVGLETHRSNTLSNP